MKQQNDENSILINKEGIKLIITLKGNLLQLKGNDNDGTFSYSSKISFEELVNKDDYFHHLKDMVNSFKFIKRVISSKTYCLEKKENGLSLVLKFDNGVEMTQLAILVNKSEKSQKEIFEFRMEMLEQRVQCLEEKLLQKDKEIELLKQNNNIIQNIKVLTEWMIEMKKKTFVEWQKIKYDDGQYYEGQTINNMKCGFGTLYGTKGEYYFGTFNNNMREGFGTKNFSKEFCEKALKVRPDITPLIQISGTYRNNNLYGLSTLFYYDGKLQSTHIYEKSESQYDYLDPHPDKNCWNISKPKYKIKL